MSLAFDHMAVASRLASTTLPPRRRPAVQRAATPNAALIDDVRSPRPGRDRAGAASDCRGDAAPRPERRRVEALLAGIGPEPADTLGSQVHDVGPQRPDVVDVDAELGPLVSGR